MAVNLKITRGLGWNPSGQEGWQQNVPFQGFAGDWRMRPELHGEPSRELSYAQEDAVRGVLDVTGGS